MKLSNLTYGALDKALASLKFESRKVDENYLASFHREYDALFTLPLAEYNALVTPSRFSVARRMITEKGVATSEEWKSAIRSALTCGGAER